MIYYNIYYSYIEATTAIVNHQNYFCCHGRAFRSHKILLWLFCLHRNSHGGVEYTHLEPSEITQLILKRHPAIKQIFFGWMET